MSFKVDIKSLLLGLVIGIIAILAIGAGSRGSNTGKYQVSIATGVRGDVIYAKIDTSTGEVESWQSPINSVPTKRK
jgi:hypothetical protein